MHSSTWTAACAAALSFGPWNLAYAQATANAVVSAEDAFGSSEGDESVGIYDQSSVRGFNLEAAGNYRINGQYFVKNSGVSSFFLERTTVRIGYNTLSLDYPGPSGAVDYKLRDPALGETSQLTIGMDPYEQPFAELHFKHRNPAETFSASLGASSRFRWANEQGGEGRDALLAGTARMTLNDRVHLQAFGGEYRYRRNGRFRVALTPGADSLPQQIERGRYLGLPWATEEGARRIFGGLANLDLRNGWSARAIGVFSQEAPDSKFTQRLLVSDAESPAQSSYIVSPEQRSHSYSAGLRLGRTFLTEGAAHNLALSARWRDSRSRYGGEQVIETGPTVLGEASAAIPFLESTNSRANLHDHIEQQGVGLSYQLALGRRLKANGGVTYSDYEKHFSNDAGASTSSQSTPWLYNFGAAARLTGRVELYGSYSRGLEEAGTAPATASNANAILEATIATQRELGFRFAVHPDVTLILAGFDTRKPQAGVNSASGAHEFVGDVRHRGIETSLSGALTSKLSAVAGAVYTDAVVSGVNVDSGIVGAQPVNVPEWRAIANLNYALSPAFSVDVGVEYVGERAAVSGTRSDRRDQLLLSDSAVVDLGARYRIDAYELPVIVRAQLLNAFDEFDWRSAPGETLDYMPQRSLRLLVTMEF
ncbi:MAG: TonB-dependent receptor domain-containing protein [Steroidobacter sp.]